MSGLSRTPGKRVWGKTHRGFESRPLRQGLPFAAPKGHKIESHGGYHQWLFCFLLGVYLTADRCHASEACA